MSSIALKGFFAGYMQKSADATAPAPGKVSPTGSALAGRMDLDTNLARGTASPEDQTPENASGALLRKGGMNTVPLHQDFHQSENYGKIYEMLKGLAPGAAIGAGVAGGITGLAGWKKPGNMRRMITMALAAGVPLGALAQILSTGMPGGSGMGGTQGLGEAGHLLAGGAKDLYKDVSTGTAHRSAWEAAKGAATGGVKGMQQSIDEGRGVVPTNIPPKPAPPLPGPRVP